MWHLIHLGMCSSLLQILLLQSLTGASLTINERKCFDLSSDSECTCTYERNYWTIICPGAEIFINTKKENEKQVVITDCSEIEINSLPKMDIDNCHDVDIVHCKLSGEPIVLLLDQLGIKNVKYLSIHSNILADNFTLLLTGLSGLEELHLILNNIVLLPPDVFKDLLNVTTLTITENLVELPQHIFDPLEKLTKLDLAKNRLNQLPEGIFRNQHKLMKLLLNGNELRNINKRTFEGAASLQRLDLSKNNLNQFEPETFSLLLCLSEINLGGNEFRELPPQLFANNKNLNILYINENKNTLDFLPSSLLANLSHLQEVYISCLNYSRNKNINYPSPRKNGNRIYISCGFRDIPGNLFTRSSNWADVSLAGNSLLLLPESIFSDQLSLNWLDLSHNKLQSLQNSLFRNTSSLILLDLSYNRLTDLSDEIFLSLGSLERLYLNNNSLIFLPDELFFETTNLVELKLSYNQLIEISAKIFSPLVKLEVLHLENNHLMTVSSDAFSESRNVRYISMENNRIKLQESAQVKTAFHLLEKLEELKLRNNSIQHIYWDWRTALPNLLVLDLSFNIITTLDYRDLTFQQKGLLVNISHNQVRTIDFEDENLMNATSNNLIDLSYNPLNCDCKVLLFLLHLSRTPYSYNRVDCDCKHLSFWTHSSGTTYNNTNFITDSLFCDKPKSLGHPLFRSIKPEELKCFIENCPRGCNCWERTFDATLIFNCSNTNLTKVPVLPVVQTITFKTIELHIENNELLELSTTSFDGYAAVTKIYATGNNISYIAVQNLPLKLTHLDLSYNNLKRLDPDLIDLFNGSHSLTSLTLAGNPWDCNCESRLWLVFAERKFFITDYKKVFCATPKKATMHDYIFDNDICQEDQRVLFTLIVSFLTVSLLISIAVTVCYKCETEIKIWVYSCRWLQGIFSEFDVDKDKKYDAFVSYSHKDREFIGTILVPELERNGPIHFKLCIHVRDFIVGEYITDQIICAIDESRRTIIVLSKHFIESTWACLEFRLAHQAAVEEGRTRIIVIMYGDIGDTDSLEPLLRAYLKTNTYLEWGDPRFWDRLREAMLHPVNAPTNETSQATTAV